MPGPLLTTAATVMCPHGGSARLIPSYLRVRSGAPVTPLNTTTTITGCPFQVPAGPAMKPQPCVRVQWTIGTLRVRVGGKPSLARTSVGICFSAEGIPQGPPVIVNTQMRVRGT